MRIIREDDGKIRAKVEQKRLRVLLAVVKGMDQWKPKNVHESGI
jgi:hypothetical protein